MKKLASPLIVIALGIAIFLYAQRPKDTLVLFQTLVDPIDYKEGQPPQDWQRSLRALALSPDGRILYTGFVLGEVNSTAALKAKFLYAFESASGKSLAKVPYRQGQYAKAAATHHSGRVYFALSDSDEILHTNSLLGDQKTVSLPAMIGILNNPSPDIDPQGVATYQNYLYVSAAQTGRIYRFLLSEKGHILKLDSAWARGGFVQLKIEDRNLGPKDDLGQLSVHPKDGSIWATARSLNKVFRVSQDGKEITSPLLVPDNANPSGIHVTSYEVLVSFSSQAGQFEDAFGVGRFTFGGRFLGHIRDDNDKLRDAEGIAFDEKTQSLYVVNGFYGSHVKALDRDEAWKKYNPKEADLIFKLSIKN